MIDHFNGEYFFLSNFYPHPVDFEGIIYPSSEHAFQAAKTNLSIERLRIRDQPSASKAKSEGRKLKLREDWEEVKDEVMYQICKEKFKDPSLAKKLLATAPRKLIEGNWWGDIYWGIADTTAYSRRHDRILTKGEGQNKLGEILMRVRSELAN
jgi:ribA/ribD-fused uncharacterized protein